jgi:glycosyltransferase involved in cell wall biosynthesis
MTDSSDPLVSVIVPAHGVERYIAECIESRLGQTYSNLEVIIIDDGSPDRSGQIADEYMHRDARIKVVHTANRGVSVARNTGIEMHTGAYLCFVDGDDMLSREFVAQFLAVALQTGAKFCISTRLWPDDGRTLIETCTGREATGLLLDGLPIGCWNKLYESKFVRENSLSFDADLYMGEGLKFVTQAAQLAPVVGVSHRGLYRYRKDNAESATTRYDINKCKNALKALAGIESSLPLEDAELRRAMAAQYWHTYFYTLETIVALRAKGTDPALYRRAIRFLRRNASSVFGGQSSSGTRLKAAIAVVAPATAARTAVIRKRQRATKRQIRPA